MKAHETVAANLRREMKARGMTQQELARRANMSQPRIAEILAGTSDYRLSTVERVAEALGIQFMALLLPVQENSLAHS